jgi:hypothetical protein
MSPSSPKKESLITSKSSNSSITISYSKKVTTDDNNNQKRSTNLQNSNDNLSRSALTISRGEKRVEEEKRVQKNDKEKKPTKGPFNRSGVIEVSQRRQRSFTDPNVHVYVNDTLNYFYCYFGNLL